MKKILIILFMFLCLTSFAQEELKLLTEFNGEDWLGLTQESKVMLISGFALAQSAITLAISDSEFIEMPEESRRIAINWLFIAKNVFDVVLAVESFYMLTGKLDYPIWNVIYIVYDKHWWGRAETNNEQIEAKSL